MKVASLIMQLLEWVISAANHAIGCVGFFKGVRYDSTTFIAYFKRSFA